ncbi:hypothetical protein FDI69_gp114 [Rhodococcus phage Trina]|uniref:DUF7246 domain-containing protein n=1 Tax=Rhodococcus phage Trina TaxID=2027905 RepID=A0A2D0ZNI5_9CAUD|nr:hypothetical protein FDI69_gp114 [Rhodococcus phage Trina]ASZ74928.1 hypothetical protein SEA_TRINA_114 [Rhodococcus phage Trina]
MVRQKKAVKDVLGPYWYNPNIRLVYELPFKKDVIVPGTLLKLTGSDRSIYRFVCLVVNSETGKEWIDVFDTNLGGKRSFYVDRIKAIHIAKKSRAKKV